MSQQRAANTNSGPFQSLLLFRRRQKKRPRNGWKTSRRSRRSRTRYCYFVQGILKKVFDIGIWKKTAEKLQKYVLLGFNQFSRLGHFFIIRGGGRKSTHGLSFLFDCGGCCLSLRNHKSKQGNVRFNTISKCQSKTFNCYKPELILSNHNSENQTLSEAMCLERLDSEHWSPQFGGCFFIGNFSGCCQREWDNWEKENELTPHKCPGPRPGTLSIKSVSRPRYLQAPPTNMERRASLGVAALEKLGGTLGVRRASQVATAVNHQGAR